MTVLCDLDFGGEDMAHTGKNEKIKWNEMKKKNKEKMENGQVMIGDAVFEHYNPNLW